MSSSEAVPAQPTPLTEHIQVTELEHVGDDLRVLARLTVDPNNPILAGHYPGLPIFPGVCLIECAHCTVLAVARSCGSTATMEALSTARFLDAVFPGDTVSVQALITRSETRWKAAATLHSQRGPAAKVTLHYHVSGGVS